MLGSLIYPRVCVCRGISLPADWGGGSEPGLVAFGRLGGRDGCGAWGRGVYCRAEFFHEPVYIYIECVLLL
jgi:hypothetical protein